jgi:electron-transferring-flavoprotein dehydrogenase
MTTEQENSNEPWTETSPQLEVERQSMEVDIACVGFGPATGGFLTKLVQAWNENPADPAFGSRVAPGMPLQVLCYERADDLAAGVSGVVTKARGISASFPALNPADIPMAASVTSERVLYLLDPVGASRRSAILRIGDSLLRLGGRLLVKDHAFELPYTPGFLRKHDGLVLSIGQFNQWVASQLMASGLVQIWPGMPVSSPLREGDAVRGIRLADQGVDKFGSASDGYMPGMDVHARLTVVGDGPVGQVGRALDVDTKTPKDWALGMKFVIELPEEEEDQLAPGTVWHTFGYPEPEIFGFMYVHPDRLVSVGIFVPSWMHDPSRTVYRYLQHYIQHPALWRVLKNGRLRSWGAKSLEESGRRGETSLCGDGFARIGEGSGSTNLLTGSGVDEAWTTGTQLGEAVLELLRTEQPFTHENLKVTYEERRRNSWVESGAREAENARNGFHQGFVRGLLGMAISGYTLGRLAFRFDERKARNQIRRYSSSSVECSQLERAAKLARQEGRPLHDALLTVRGWPEVPYDGRLLISQQDALLIGGKVQANPGFADHVRFINLQNCAACDEKTCVAMCSGQAITEGADSLPSFEREKCVHCGGCVWNCKHDNVEFDAGAGGLHSAEN